MYAVIKSGGKQYRVSEGQTLNLEKMPVNPGDVIEFDQVLMLSDTTGLKFGTPLVKGAKVKAEVLSNGRAEKIRVIKFRRRKHYRRQMGHRQHFTQVKITAIQ